MGLTQSVVYAAMVIFGTATSLWLSIFAITAPPDHWALVPALLIASGTLVTAAGGVAVPMIKLLIEHWRAEREYRVVRDNQAVQLATALTASTNNNARIVELEAINARLLNVTEISLSQIVAYNNKPSSKDIQVRVQELEAASQSLLGSTIDSMKPPGQSLSGSAVGPSPVVQ